jgi:hypothetical protein
VCLLRDLAPYEERGKQTLKHYQPPKKRAAQRSAKARSFAARNFLALLRKGLNFGSFVLGFEKR